MKVWVLSDLHLEVADLEEPLASPDADVCVVAGDLCRGAANGVRWLAENVAPAMECVYIAGNHEFYGSAIAEQLELGRQAADATKGVNFLENSVAWIRGVRFWGATLWTDFQLEGSPAFSMSVARARMNDYRRINLVNRPWMRFVPQAAAYMHGESRAFLHAALTALSDATVVVTHHLPHRNSVHPRFGHDPLNAAYASDLSGLIEEGEPKLWIHGHTHDSCDYMVGMTRIVCNPRGYGRENTTFDAGFLVEVDT